MHFFEFSSMYFWVHSKVSHNKPCFPLAKKKRQNRNCWNFFLCVHCSDTSSEILALLRTFLPPRFHIVLYVSWLAVCGGSEKCWNMEKHFVGCWGIFWCGSRSCVWVSVEKSMLLSFDTFPEPNKQFNSDTKTQMRGRVAGSIRWRKIKESDNSLHTVDTSSARRVDIWDLFYMFALFVRLCKTSCRCITSSDHKTHSTSRRWWHKNDGN